MQPDTPSHAVPLSTSHATRYQDTLEATMGALDFSAAAIRKRVEAAEKTSLETTRSDITLPVGKPPLMREPSLAARAPERFSGAVQGSVRYEVHELLGAGASGEVYRATDLNLGREVAVKFLRTQAAGGRDREERFVHEARVTAQLEHPSILPVYELDLADDGRAYFAMRRAAGQSLGSLIRSAAAGDTPAELGRTVDRLNIFMKICEALAYAHHKGIVHQDVKPDNVMIGRFGEVVLVDWGTAAFTAELAHGQARIVGTPAYMAPEQARLECVDERSDVYCLGATFFHLLTLRHPTWSEDPEEFWKLKRAGTVNADLHALPQDVPAGLVDIALCAMAPAPGDRFQSVKGLQEAILEYETHAESIGIVERCRPDLAEAVRTGSYDRFAHLIVDLKQSLRLWPGNEAASALLNEARRAYAIAALERGDLTLATSAAEGIAHDAGLAARIAAARALLGRRRRQALATWMVAGALALALGAAVAYLAVEYYRQFGRWQPIFHRAFDHPGSRLDGLAFSSQQLDRDDTLPALTGGGLRLAPGRMVWVETSREAGDVRVEARLRWRKRVDGAEMMINTRREQPAQNGWCPTGYSCQFGGSSGRLTFISRNDVPQPPRQGGAAGVRFEPDRTYRLWFQRTGDELALFVDGRRVYQQAEPLPLAGEGLDRVAFRSWGTVDLLSISVWRLGSPTRASPVVAGDALARRGHHVQAAEEYRRIAADHPRTATAEKALARAYLLSALLPDTGDGERTLVRTLLRQQHARSRYWPRLLESDCMEAWRAGRLDEALGLARDAMSRDPDTRIALQLLASRQSAIPVQILVPLLGLLSRTTRVTSLDLSGLGLEDLSPIGGMQLTYLDCSSNHLTTLEPLAGMKLEGLVCSSNRIESLKPLAGMPLVDVGLDGCLIEDLTPLAQAQLAALSCFGNPLRSLTPFDGLRPANLFLFSTASLPKGHLDSVFEVWERNGHMSTLREAELVRALEKGDRQTLLRRASTHQGHHYLHVRLALPWAEADRLSRAIGGHLLTLADREEQEFAIGLVGPGGSTWLGLRSGAADREWVTGEPLAYTAFDGPRDRQAETPCLLLSGRDPSRCWFAADVGEELSPLVIEWDR